MLRFRKRPAVAVLFALMAVVLSVATYITANCDPIVLFDWAASDSNARDGSEIRKRREQNASIEKYVAEWSARPFGTTLYPDYPVELSSDFYGLDDECRELIFQVDLDSLKVFVNFHT